MRYQQCFWLVLVLFPLAGAPTSLTAGEGVFLGKMKADRILFLGNSITRHGPAPQIGWNGDWGMAASSENKDYVHLLTDAIATRAGGKPEILAHTIVKNFERSYAEKDYDAGARLAAALTFKPDIVIVAIGENVAPLSSEEARRLYQTRFKQLLDALKATGNPKIFVRSTFWPDTAKDNAMREACKAAGGVFVDIRDIGRDRTNQASSDPGRTFIHDGVAAHPGDAGMKAIAERLFRDMAAHAEKQ